jgi:hypothetical protein
MEAVDYHFVYAAARLFWGDFIAALRMTGFNFGARGHAKHLLKSPEGKVAQGRTKSKYYLSLAANAPQAGR